MPLHWGSGMVYNAGNNPLDEFGDSVDRIQFTAKEPDVTNVKLTVTGSIKI